MRFSTFLLLFLFFLFLKPQATAQNLIYDWSVEEYETCPTGLALTPFVPHWLSFRGNPDYFNFCSPTTLGPLTNAFGWQYPRTGDGLMGVITHHSGFLNGREFPGVMLIDTMEIGEVYEISFFAAAAFNPNSSGLATNNLGILLMTENYLDPNEIGTVPNFAHLNVDSIISDTANWVHISGTIVADSAYKYVAFGNFFDDENTMVMSLDPDDPDPSNLAYYYFDDFCVVPEGGDCAITLSVRAEEPRRRVKIFPNPCTDRINVESQLRMQSLAIFSTTGVLLERVMLPGTSETQVDVSGRIPGIYILEVETEEEVTRSKFVINP